MFIKRSLTSSDGLTITLFEDINTSYSSSGHYSVIVVSMKKGV